MLALAHGPEQAASFQATVNVLGITNPVTYGINNLIVPACAARQREEPALQIWRAAWKLARWGLLVLAPCYLLLLLWPHTVLQLLYGPSSVFFKFTAALTVLCC